MNSKIILFFLFICAISGLCSCAEKKEEIIPTEITITSPIRQTIEGKHYAIPYFVDNLEAKDCTYEELLTFLRRDRTDQLASSANTNGLNSCEFYALTLHDNAEKAGIRCGFTIVTFEGVDPEYGRYGHAIDAFHTMDRGIIYIDDTKSSFKDVVPSDECSCSYSFDKIADVIVGEEYIPKRLFNDHASYKPMGVVESVDTYWNELK